MPFSPASADMRRTCKDDENPRQSADQLNDYDSGDRKSRNVANRRWARQTSASLNRKSTMVRSIVNSSAIRSVGYDGATATLEVEFMSGAVYEYREIPEQLYIDLLSAESKGGYFDAHVRCDRYPCRRLS